MYTLIIVDDNPFDILGIKELLDWDALNIRIAGTAEDGEQGLELAHNIRPDLVLADISMPIIDGLEMARRLRAFGDDAPEILFMSCYDDTSFLKKAIDLEVVSYIFKPVDTDELTYALKKACNRIDMRRAALEDQHVLRTNRLKRNLRELLGGDTLYAPMELQSLGVESALPCLSIIIRAAEGMADSPQWRDYAWRRLLCQALNCPEEYLTEFWPGELVALLSPLNEASRDPLALLARAARGFDVLAAADLTGADLCLGQPVASLAALPSAHGILRQTALKLPSTVTRRFLLDEWWWKQAALSAEEVEELLKKKGGGRKAFLARLTDPACSLTARLLSLHQLINCASAQCDPVFGDDWIGRFSHVLQTASLDTALALAGDIFDHLAGRSDALSDQRIHSIANDIRAVIDQNYATLENVQQIVENLYISPNHAVVLFKKITGQTIFAYLTWRRMEEAQRLLNDPYVQVADVAQLVGYQTPAHFRETFRKHTGLSPNQYRRKVLKEAKLL